MVPPPSSSSSVASRVLTEMECETTCSWRSRWNAWRISFAIAERPCPPSRGSPRAGAATSSRRASPAALRRKLDWSIVPSRCAQQNAEQGRATRVAGGDQRGGTPELRLRERQRLYALRDARGHGPAGERRGTGVHQAERARLDPVEPERDRRAVGDHPRHDDE